MSNRTKKYLHIKNINNKKSKITEKFKDKKAIKFKGEKLQRKKIQSQKKNIDRKKSANNEEIERKKSTHEQDEQIF